MGQRDGELIYIYQCGNIDCRNQEVCLKAFAILQKSYKQNTLQTRSMGIECTRSPARHLPSHYTQKLDSLQAEMRRLHLNLHFTMKIENLRLTNFNKNIHCIRFKLERDFCITIPLSQFSIQQNLIKLTKEYRAEFETPASQIESKIVSIIIEDKLGRTLEILQIKLHHLCTGPYHHDHLLKELHSRLIFDFYINQTIQIDVKCQNLSVQLENPSFQDGQYEYCMAMIVTPSLKQFPNKNQVLESEPSFKNGKNGNPVQIKSKLNHSQIKESSLKITLFKIQNDEPQNSTNWIKLFIPYSKILEDSRHGCNLVSIKGINYQSRKISICQNLQKDGSPIGKAKFQIYFIQSRQYTEQMDCLILSENGIVTVNTNNTLADEEVINLQAIEKLIKRIKKMKNYSIDQKYQVKKTLQEVNQAIKGTCNYAQEDLLADTQLKLTQLLVQIPSLLSEGEEVMNQAIWVVSNAIIHKEQLSLRYLNAINNFKVKKKICLNYYRFICMMLSKIIQSTKNGITFQELICIQKFISFAYFRFPWCQLIVVSALSKPEDPVISEEKLTQIGASLTCKSPSKSIVYDWQTHIFNQIKNQEEFKQIFGSLSEISDANEEWAKMLFNRNYQDLFYGIYIQLWNEAETTLTYHGRVMWEYFPNYGKLISSFLGEMNNNRIVDYSSQFKKCSMKLIGNQKLLNTFMMLLFPKTCLYQTYCVMKCLDLVAIYFAVIVGKERKLPYDFHFNYFYSGIKCIFESNHSYLLVKTLVIIYKYFHIFSPEFQKLLNQYISGRVFNQLFLHWCQNVRKTFHLLLEFKLRKNLNVKSELNPQTSEKREKSLIHLEKIEISKRYTTLIEDLYEIKKKEQKHASTVKLPPVKQQYFEIMKQKLESRKIKSINRLNQLKTESEIQSIELDCIYSYQELDQEQLTRKISMCVASQTNLNRIRKWSTIEEDQGMTRVTEEGKKYISISLDEFEKIRSEKNPEAKIEETAKLFQQNMEE